MSEPPATNLPPTRWVLLRHDTPDSSFHFDLMLERQTPSDRRLITFRLASAPTWSTNERFTGARLPDHRSLYLDFEGDLSGNRGTVHRLAADALHNLHVTPSRLFARLQTTRGTITITGNPGPADTWTFSVDT